MLVAKWGGCCLWHGGCGMWLDRDLLMCSPGMGNMCVLVAGVCALFVLCALSQIGSVCV